MKKLILLFLLPILSFSQETKVVNANGKTIIRCGKDQHMTQLLSDPIKAKEYYQKLAKVGDPNTIPYKALCTNTTTLPIAVHFQGTNYNNLTAAQKTCLTNLALSQIEVLNADYGGTNTEISNWLSSVKPNHFPTITHGETCVRFCLATQNHPSGYNLTNGQYAVTFNQTGNSTQVNAWAGYINIFVAADNTGTLGFSPLGGAGDGDGIFINEDAFGLTGFGCIISPVSPYNKGRTLTHEMGHYLLLDHIWGDSNCGNDLVSDTPLHNAENYGCPSLPHYSTCTGTPKELTMNYMDYTDDACMYMFTAGQKTRMETYLSSNLTAVKNNYTVKCTTTCSNGVMDGNETGIDCGGTCTPCPSCSDGIQNQNETGIDCGGICGSVCPTCTDGIQNGTETGVDCGGTCTACPLCPAGATNLISESFNGCAKPTGWTTSHTSSAANNTGTCKDNITGTTFSFACTDEYPFTGSSTGATPTAGFSGCLAVIDDDDLGQGTGTTGTGCIITPAVNTTTYSTINLSYDYQNEPYQGSGIFTVDVWNGTAWVNLQTVSTSASAHATYNISTHSNAALKVRFCYNDESDWAWGAAIDNIAICGTGTASSCTDGIQNGTETGIDCGGTCTACATCTDGIQNGTETGIDCGGTCTACATCTDGIQNGSETGIDCGGTCTACATCTDGIQNGSETGIDCGGTCTACATCTDGIQNGSETGIDCGGTCTACLGFKVNITAVLEGPYSTANNTMVNALRTNGILPLQQPFAIAPFYYTGNEGVSSLSSIPTNIVDWVLVEVRSASNPATVLGTRAAWINQNGLLVELDGTTGVRFTTLPAGTYYFALYHKGHLAVMTNNPLTVPNAITYDFSTGVSQADGVEQLKLKGNKYTLFAADVDNNNVINNLDYNQWYSNSAAVNQYLHFDIDCNGVVNSLDYNLWYANRSKVGNTILGQ